MTIVRMSNGWYDFSGLDQSNRYIKVSALNCITDRKAINTARKIIGDKKAPIEIVDLNDLPF